MIVICENPSCLQRLKITDEPGTYSVACPACRRSFRVQVLPPTPTLPPPPPSPCDFVIYDLETTGLRPDSEEIIQIAAVRFRDGRVLGSETFATFARPQHPISRFITSYTGISNAHVADAPRPHEALKEFARFVGRARLIAHNGHRFDSKFLGATCSRHSLASMEVGSIDSINLSKRMFGTVRGTGHSLDRVLSRLGISSVGHSRHDARGDVELLGRAVEKMWSGLGLDPLCTGIRTHTTVLPVSY